MSNDLKTASQPIPSQTSDRSMRPTEKTVPNAKLVRCEICGQVFDSRNVGELVHHSLMGPGHGPLPH